MGGDYKIYPGLLAPGMQGFDKKAAANPVVYDPEGAKRLLRKNGWTKNNLPTLEYSYISVPVGRQRFEAFKGLMKKIGYPKGKIKGVPFPTNAEKIKALFAQKIMIINVRWGPPSPDPDSLFNLYYSGNIGGWNFNNFKNAEYDRLFEEMRILQPSPYKNKLIARMNQIIVDECVQTESINVNRLYLWHKNVTYFPDVHRHHIFKYAHVD